MTADMEYVWNKHEHADDYKTLEPLIAGYAHNLDYDWSFELYLLYKKEEKQNEAATLAELYHASFKNSDNSQIILISKLKSKGRYIFRYICGH